MEKFHIKRNAPLYLQLEDKPLGDEGAQGAVYKVVSPSQMSSCCVKIYHKECDNDKVRRLTYMIQNPPSATDTSSFRICWPTDIVYDDRGKARGFMMPLAFPKSRDLYILSYYSKMRTISQRFKKDTDWHGKYERSTGTGILNRLKMLANISLAFYHIHSMNRYVVLDIKPVNILATSSGLISVVDTDSFQIAEKDNLLFPGAAATPEYCAPEFDEQNRLGKPFTVTNDLFSIAVLFYQIIMGLHPFTGIKLLPPYDTDEYSELKPKIQRSLYIYGINKRYIEPLDPNPHAFFERMPRSLQKMFIRAFDAPNYRPTMEEWCKELHKLISSVR
ncbi:MAG: hypothetical protein NC453_16975 [Muribaculum sp.]|nr:hypothetical protein [Muribaculum sp.]